MRIKSIKLEHFQSHRRRVVKFGSGITTIVGASDRGKSAILRGLGWALRNNMPGDSFITEGEKKATVKVKVETEDDIHVVSRSRSRSGVVNTYEMDGDEYKAFGRNVPEDIAAKLQLSELNFQGQYDSPFWFSETAGEVSRRLNAVIDLSVIDSSMKYVGDLVRRNKIKKELAEEALAAVLKELDERKGDHLRIACFKELERLNKTQNECEDDRHKLDRLIARAAASQPTRYQKRASNGQTVLDLGADHSAHINKAGELRRLLVLFARHRSAGVRPPDHEPLEAMWYSQLELFDKVGHLRDIVQRLETACRRVDNTANIAKKTEATFHKRIKGKTCPLCSNQVQ